ncbi:hypothetical protein BC834DRAFT_554153 [Gloeopeniophorella convolvens]|nr:hypothetical protein BC834DRAFT_554153 [Gloeopeniophorella convolvens]
MSSYLLNVVPEKPVYDISAVRTMVDTLVSRLDQLEGVWSRQYGEVPEVLSLRAVSFSMHRICDAILPVFNAWRRRDVQLTLHDGLQTVRQSIKLACVRRDRGDALPAFSGSQNYTCAAVCDARALSTEPHSDVEAAKDAALHFIDIVNKAVSLIIQLGALQLTQSRII